MSFDLKTVLTVCVLLAGIVTSYVTLKSQVAAQQEQIKELKPVPAQVYENTALIRLTECQYHQPRQLPPGSVERYRVCWCEYEAAHTDEPMVATDMCHKIEGYLADSLSRARP